MNRLTIVPAVIMAALISASAVASTQNTCLFGEDLSELDASNRLEAKVLAKTVKLYRGPEGDSDQPARVSVTELRDPKTHAIYHLNLTFEDEFDGGNTSGWIEDYNNLNVVAVVSDSSIENCKIRLSRQDQK